MTMSGDHTGHASAGTPLLDIDGLSVVYPDGFTAVRDASLRLPPGQIFALLGASGSGKSTLLRGVAGLEATRGRVLLEGRDVSRVPAHLRGIGMVFQEGLLFPHRTVGANISYALEGPAARGGIPRSERAARIDELLELVDLPGFAERAITTLSGGQAQRVALARALARRPRLMLLDEPLSALDTDLREELSRQLREILSATGTGALYVTHDPAEAERVADRILRIDAGVLADSSVIAR